MSIFGLFSKKKKVESPLVFEANEKLKTAIARHTEEPDNMRIKKLLFKAVSQGFLMVAVDRPPPTDFSGRITETTTVQMLTSSGPTGGSVIQAFTDGNEAARRIGNRADIGVISQNSIDVLNIVLDADYEGIVINAAGPWVVIKKSEVRDIVAGKYA
jgi:hypothetical protein